MLRKLIYYILKNNRKFVLEKIINDNKLESFIELGVREGDTSLYLLNNCKSLKKIYLIDTWDYDAYNNTFKEGDINEKDKNTYNNEVDLIYKKVLSRFSNNNKVIIIKDKSINAIKLFKNSSIDIIFIDAEHIYLNAKEDIIKWKSIIKKNGYVTGHDYSLNYFGVVTAVNEVLGMDNIIVSDDSVWIYKKKGE